MAFDPLIVPLAFPGPFLSLPLIFAVLALVDADLIWQSAFTVGAADRNGRIARFSSWGLCVEAFAPGMNIASAWIGSSTTNVLSGNLHGSPNRLVNNSGSA
ncbi:hypothetical protein BGZ92_001926 [Podila epicladia]|nr:hypothetical protein BGZ92_001926 [Podila epicladia]